MLNYAYLVLDLVDALSFLTAMYAFAVLSHLVGDLLHDFNYKVRQVSHFFFFFPCLVLYSFLFFFAYFTYSIYCMSSAQVGDAVGSAVNTEDATVGDKDTRQL